jgi:hypothetical protein
MAGKRKKVTLETLCHRKVTLAFGVYPDFSFCFKQWYGD